MRHLILIICAFSLCACHSYKEAKSSRNASVDNTVRFVGKSLEKDSLSMRLNMRLDTVRITVLRENETISFTGVNLRLCDTLSAASSAAGCVEMTDSLNIHRQTELVRQVEKPSKKRFCLIIILMEILCILFLLHKFRK